MAFKLTPVSRDAAGIEFIMATGNATARDFPTAEHVYFDAVLGRAWASHKVVLDMDAVPFLDSSAIGWLIHSQKSFREAGGMLVLHSVQPHVRNILSLLKIERVVPIGNDADAARVLVQARPAAAVLPVA